MGPRQSFQIMVPELDTPAQKMNLDTHITPFTNVNSKWNADLNAKQKTLKTLENTTGENLADLRYGDDILDTTAKARSVKGRTVQLDGFCSGMTLPKEQEDKPETGRKYL